MSSTYYDLEDALVALLDKLDVVEKAIDGMFVLAHVHGMPYDGPNYKEEYDRCRELTGTTRNEVLDEPPPENPAMFWFLDVKNQEYLKKWSGQNVAVIETDHGFDVVAAHANLNELLAEFHGYFGEIEPVYFGYVPTETVLTVTSTRENND